MKKQVFTLLGALAVFMVLVVSVSIMKEQGWFSGMQERTYQGREKQAIGKEEVLQESDMNEPIQEVKRYSKMEECETLGGGERDMCYFDVGGNVNDEAVCMKIEDVSTKENCLLNIAIRKGDETLCKRISSEEMHDSCLFSLMNNRGVYDRCDELKKEENKTMCLQK